VRGITLNKSVDLKSEKTRMTSLSQRPTACASRQKYNFFLRKRTKNSSCQPREAFRGLHDGGVPLRGTGGLIVGAISRIKK